MIIKTIFAREGKLSILFRNFRDKVLVFLGNHKKKSIAALILLIVLFSSIFLKGGTEGPLVSTGEVLRNSFEQSVFATGKLEVKDKQDFYAESGTAVKEILANPGDKVAKGQVILKLDENSLVMQEAKDRAAYEETKYRLATTQSTIRVTQKECELAEKDYERTRALFQAGAVSQQELETKEKELIQVKEKLILERDANLPLLQSQLEGNFLVWARSQELLSKSTIISPMEGVLLNLPVKAGQRVEPGALLASIGNLLDLQVETGINEVDASYLKAGDKVEISNNALIRTPFLGHIEYISPIAVIEKLSQGEQTQVKIRVAVDKVEESANLKPGFNVNLKVILHHKDEALLVPYEAVIKSNDQEMVFVVDKEGNVSERTIQTGLSNELFFEVLSGLEVGERVILSPGQQIKNGIKVKTNDPNK